MATPPPPVPPPAPPPPTPAVRLVLVVEGVPRAVADLPPNSPVPARVAQAVARGGMVQLQTAFGVLTARAPVALPAGAEVTLRTQPAQPGQAVLRLMTVNGRPPVTPPPLGALGGAPAAGSALPPGTAGPSGPGALGAGRTATPGGPGQSTPTGAPSATATGGAALPPSAASGRGLLTATVVRAAGGTGAAMPGATGGLGGAAGLTVGSRLSVFVTGIQPPGAAGQGAAMPSGAGAGPNPAPGMPGAAGAAGAGGPAGLGTGAGAGTPSGSPDGTAGAAARAAQSGGPGRPGSAPWVLSPGSAGATSASPGANSGGQPGTLGGTVLNGGAPSATLLRTSAGTVALPVRLDAPPGSTITLAVTRVDPAPPGGEGIRPMGPMTGGRGWPTLPQALETLARADPAAARGLEAMIPRPGPHLAAAMITLTGALRIGGDVRQWPGGSTIRALDRAGPTGARLAAALKEDVGALAGQVRDSPGGEWRAYTLPFADQAEISPIRLIIGPYGGGDAPDQDDDGEGRPGGDGDGDGQRFLVDVSLSVLGRVQLDGIVDAASHRLRLLLRTAEPLPGPLRADLLRLTEDSLFALGFQGGLAFQADGGFFDPVPDAPIEAEEDSSGWPRGDGGTAPDGGVIA